jgi:hypothetical protein
MSRASALLFLVYLSGLIACDSSDTEDNTTDAVTLVAVDSKFFPTAVSCTLPESGALPGGAYVADLFDVSLDWKNEKETQRFLVQSSPPVPCGRGIAFAKVTENRSYDVRVRIYPDLDGDPTTVDICTLAPTNVTVKREGGQCTSSLATANATLHCFGWEKPTDPDSSDAGAPIGMPVLALDQRKVLASYCEVSKDEEFNDFQ